MTITLAILLLIYVFYLIIKWSLKFAILLLLVLVSVGFVYNIGLTKKLAETSEYLHDKSRDSKV